MRRPRRRHSFHVTTIIMAEPTVEKYYEAFNRSYAKLKDALPINNLLPYFFEAGAVPGDLKEKLNSILVRSEKVICLLDEMELGLKVGITDQFESFICVMEKFGDSPNFSMTQINYSNLS